MKEVSRFKRKPIAEWLQEVDYSDNPNYIPSNFALEFLTFIKLVNGGEGEENVSPVIHLKMLDKLDGGLRNVANMIFRGAGKTTLMAEYLILFLAVYGRMPSFGKVKLVLYVSDSIDNGVKSMRKNLESRWESSEFLQKYLPKEGLKLTDIRWEFKNINGTKFVAKGYGAKTGIRGVKEMGTRPQMAILDDLVSNDDSRSPTVIQAIKDTVGQAIKYALHPKKSKTIWLGTPFNANDPLYEAMESGAWDVSVYPICEKFHCTREEFKGAWEDRFDYDYVEAMYQEALAQGMVNGFYQELMLQIMSDEDRLVVDGDLRWFTLKNLMDNKNNFNFYITTDFATSEKQSADFSFISVWAVNNKGNYFWVDGICKRQTMDKNIDDLFLFANKYKPMSVGIEVSGQQGGFIPWIEKEMMTRNIYFLLASSSNESKPGIRPHGTKLERFNIVVPDFKLGRFHFPVEKKLTIPVKEMLLEISQAAIGGLKSKHDDAIDTISMLSLMQIWLPSEESNWMKSKGDIWGMEVAESRSSLNNYIV